MMSLVGKQILIEQLHTAIVNHTKFQNGTICFKQRQRTMRFTSMQTDGHLIKDDDVSDICKEGQVHDLY